MATNPFVKSTVTTAPVGATAPGFGTPLLVSYASTPFGAARAKIYTDMDSIEADWSPLSMEHRAASAFFAAHPGSAANLSRIVIGRGTNAPTMVYTQSIASVVAGETYHFDVSVNLLADVDIDIVAGSTDVAITTVTAATDILTKVAHGMLTGAGPYYVSTSSALPAGLTVNTPYWVIRIDDDSFKLATSAANASAGTAIDITTAGTGTQTVVRTGNDVLAEGIVAAFNAVVGKNYTAALAGVTGSKTWTVTASAAGNWFAIGVDHDLITSAVTHADPGLASDLSAIRVFDSSWYELHTAYNSTAMVLAGASWVESNASDMQYHADVSATATANAIVGAAAANDVADTLRTLNRARTAVWYHSDPAMFLSCAMAGRVLGTNPGKIQYAHKQLTGVVPQKLTDTQRGNLANDGDTLGKNVNSYSTFDKIAISFYGRVSAGEWIDVVRDIDSVRANIKASVFTLQLQNDKIGMTPDGRLQIKNAIQDQLKQAVTDGILRDDEETSPVIDLPLIEEIPVGDRRKRKFKTAKWTAKSAGAVVFVDASGTVTF